MSSANGRDPILHICTTCRRAGTPAENLDGRRLFELVEALLADRADPPARLNGVECMSGCNRACTIALTCSGKPTYMFGDVVPDPEVAAQLLDLATLYRQIDSGILLRSERPAAFRSGILARIPPVFA